MSGSGAPESRPVEGASGLRVAVIASLWHTDVMDGLLGGAHRALEDAGVTDVVELRVPGTFELTVAASRMAAADVDVIVALGVVVRGGTPHFDYVCEAATQGLTSISERTGIPVGFGVLTCDNEQQALDRAGLSGSRENKGYEAASAALQTAVVLQPFGRPS